MQLCSKEIKDARVRQIARLSLWQIDLIATRATIKSLLAHQTMRGPAFMTALMLSYDTVHALDEQIQSDRETTSVFDRVRLKALRHFKDAPSAAQVPSIESSNSDDVIGYVLHFRYCLSRVWSHEALLDGLFRALDMVTDETASWASTSALDPETIHAQIDHSVQTLREAMDWLIYTIPFGLDDVDAARSSRSPPSSSMGMLKVTVTLHNLRKIRYITPGQRQRLCVFVTVLQRELGLRWLEGLDGLETSALKDHPLLS